MKLEALTKLTPGDVRYLESKGCLHVPSGPHIEEDLHDEPESDTGSCIIVDVR